MPVHDGASFVHEAISSVLSQTYPDFELIVVDDGSTDATAAILAEAGAKDSRVLLIRQGHRGVADALNAGLERASGRYIARMDADDIAYPTRLQQQVAYLDEYPRCVSVGSNMDIVDEDGALLATTALPATHDEIVHSLLHGHGGLAHPTVMMRRAAVLSAGRYDPSCFPSEDLDLWLRLCALGDLANLPVALLRYRRHARAVGYLERRRQLVITPAILRKARRQRGLPDLADRHSGEHVNVAANYHFECTCLALRVGNRRAALKHARATIRCAPWWWKPYAALAVNVLPASAIARLVRLYRRPAGRRDSTSWNSRA